MKSNIASRSRRSTANRRLRKKPLRQRNVSRKRKARVSGQQTANRANQQLSRFRQASVVAVAITMLLLTVFSDGEAVQDTAQDQVLTENVQDTVTEAEANPDQAEDGELENIGQAATDEAISTIRELWAGFYDNLPKLLIAMLALLFAWLMLRLIRPLLRRGIGHWNNASAILAVLSISVWLLAAGIALSVLAGDIRALVGSVGLVGLALSWALQTPIESFTGWLLNSFQGYYRVGDRIEVGDVFGDVYKIDSLTTTVWEIGGHGREGAVQAEQPTGRLVTFPNNEILTGSVINLTRDFPYVWDELAVPIANESDLHLALQVLEKVSVGLLKDYMKKPAQQYSDILKRANLESQIAATPLLFVSSTDSWTEISIRYLVGARERRVWKSKLQMHIMDELNKPEYVGKIISVYPRQQLQFVQPDGHPMRMQEYANGKKA